MATQKLNNKKADSTKNGKESVPVNGSMGIFMGIS